MVVNRLEPGQAELRVVFDADLVRFEPIVGIMARWEGPFKTVGTAAGTTTTVGSTTSVTTTTTVDTTTTAGAKGGGGSSFPIWQIGGALLLVAVGAGAMLLRRRRRGLPTPVWTMTASELRSRLDQMVERAVSVSVMSDEQRGTLADDAAMMSAGFGELGVKGSPMTRGWATRLEEDILAGRGVEAIEELNRARSDLNAWAAGSEPPIDQSSVDRYLEGAPDGATVPDAPQPPEPPDDGGIDEVIL